MTVPSIQESNRHTTNALVLTILTAVFLSLGGACLFFSNTSWAIIFTIIAIIIGNNAVNHFENAAELKPSPIPPSLELFSASLKNGSPCSILIDLQFPTEHYDTHAVDRVRGRLQRAINIALAEVEELPPNPYPFMDEILRMQCHLIAKELGLASLDLKAIDIKTTPRESAPGVFLRES